MTQGSCHMSVHCRRPSLIADQGWILGRTRLASRRHHPAAQHWAGPGTAASATAALESGDTSTLLPGVACNSEKVRETVHRWKWRRKLGSRQARLEHFFRSSGVFWNWEVTWENKNGLQVVKVVLYLLVSDTVHPKDLMHGACQHSSSLNLSRHVSRA